MQELVSIESILEWLEKSAQAKEPINPSLYIDACTRLNILVGDEDDKLADLQHEIAVQRQIHIGEGLSVASANAWVESLGTYTEMLKQKAKIERITEAIKISKLQARLKSDELHGY